MRRFFVVGMLLEVACAGAQTRNDESAQALGVEFLLRSQNSDGSWGSARGTSGFEVLADVPGSHEAFQLATTALCVMALQQPATSDARASESRKRGLEYLSTTEVRRATPGEIYNVWAHAYALQALAEEHQKEPNPRWREAALRHIEWLQRFETTYGGWNYYDFEIGSQRPGSKPTSFATATVLVAFKRAQDAGLEVPDGLVKRGVRILEQCRKPDGAYLYDLRFRFRPLHMANRDKGSLGRSQPCNLASWWHGQRVTQSDLRAGLERMFREHRFMEIGRKRQFPHEAWYMTSGYYYYYGHYYAALILDELGPEDRARFGPLLKAAIVPYQEPDGSWWDYKMYDYHKAYGTAFALLTVQRLMP